MSNFSTEWKEELKARNDIVSTISRYIQLQKKGKSYWCCCPFHYEKTPSFCINETEQFFKCFGCGESGDVITFVQKYEGIDFIEAVELLAKNAGMEVPKLESSEDSFKNKQEKEQVLNALKEAARYFHSVLKTPQGKVALEYLQKRGVSSKSISTFGIGFDPDFESMKNHLIKKGFSLDILKKAGLIEFNQNTNKPYDNFGERLMFPLINSYGEVIGFSGRIIENKAFAKYKNSPQTIVFDKSRVIFGINLIKKLKNEIRTSIPKIVLVEGQLDVVSMHQAGFNYAVACLGTAVTPLHAKELKRMTDNIVLLLDGDSAGQKATLRSIDVLKPSGLSVKVATIPDGMDPDEFLKTHTTEDMQNLIDGAMEAIDFQLKSLATNFDLSSNEQKAKYIEAALKIIRPLKTDAEKNIYLDVIRKLTNIPVDILRQDLNNIKMEETVETKTPSLDPSLGQDAFIRADRFILASLLYKKSWAKQDELDSISFMSKDAEKLFDYIKQSSPQKPAFVSGVFDRIDVENSPFVQSVINTTFNDETGEKLWKDCLIKNKERKLLIEKDELEKELVKSDTEQRKIIAKKLFEIDIKLAKLKVK